MEMHAEFSEGTKSAVNEEGGRVVGWEWQTPSTVTAPDPIKARQAGRLAR